ncbi:MAG TPA: sugar ABC transporter substrate-binding protein, partial [Oceanithermus profundus]|nr:sugar ABC transporter substrate-binding protein [Oceanithermus profundus]
DLWTASVNILNGKMQPEEAAKWMECRLASWYGPHKHFASELNCK